MAIQSTKVVGIAGSLRAGSYNRGLLRAAQELAPPNLTVELFELKGVPFYDGDLEEQGGHEQTFGGDAYNDRFVAGTRHRQSGFRNPRRSGLLTSRKRALQLSLSKVSS